MEAVRARVRRVWVYMVGFGKVTACGNAPGSTEMVGYFSCLIASLRRYTLPFGIICVCP